MEGWARLSRRGRNDRWRRPPSKESALPLPILPRWEYIPSAGGSSPSFCQPGNRHNRRCRSLGGRDRLPGTCRAAWKEQDHKDNDKISSSIAMRYALCALRLFTLQTSLILIRWPTLTEGSPLLETCPILLADIVSP